MRGSGAGLGLPSGLETVVNANWKWSASPPRFMLWPAPTLRSQPARDLPMQERTVIPQPC